MVEQTLRVTSIRSQNPRGFGGCIFSGTPIDDQGRVQDAGAYYVVKVTSATLGGERVQPGQWWKVYGEASRRFSEVNGYKVTEWQIDASSAFLAHPSGEHVVAFMADSPAFEGIGHVKARKLWESFGSRLYEILDSGDADVLAAVLTPESARQVASAWAQHGDSRTLQWLQTQGFDVALGRKVVQFFGMEAAAKLEEDPYRLLSFCAGWKQVDALARSRFSVADDDPRRLQGAIEEACYRLFAAGHTVAPSSLLMSYLESVLGGQTEGFRWRTLIPIALDQGLTNGSFVVAEQGVQPLGPLVMEAMVARAVADRLLPEQDAQLLAYKDVSGVMADYELAEGITLNAEQRLAVRTAAANAVVLIMGGAGVGKTTVLKALYEVYDRAGVCVIQVALAGRAAKRMQEATGRSASTIASFLRGLKDGDLSAPTVLVIDEASMVDIITMSRICESLPPEVRLVLVGDPSQLMPVGPGLVLHALAGVPGIPSVELTVVKRYGGEISAAAMAIREGAWPALPVDEAAAIAFVPCATRSGASVGGLLAETVLRLYEQDPENTQILASRRNGPGSTKTLNAICQTHLTSGAQPLMTWSDEHDSRVHTGIHLGDPLLCTRNMWDRGLQNGSLGIVVQIEDEPRRLTGDAGEELGDAIAWVEWDDGIRRPIAEEMLDDLELGYAITVHKAQGSQWPRVIVPVTGNRLLDRTLIYTAVTRAQRQVILVGDEQAARHAVVGLPRAQLRQVALGHVLQRMIDDS